MFPPPPIFFFFFEKYKNAAFFNYFSFSILFAKFNIWLLMWVYFQNLFDLISLFTGQLRDCAHEFVPITLIRFFLVSNLGPFSHFSSIVATTC